MKNLKLWWALLFVVFVLPYVPLVLGGFLWLYEHRALWGWLAVTGVLTLVGWGLGQWLRRRTGLSAAGAEGALAGDDVQPDPMWAPAGRQAWEQVQRIAQRVSRENPPLDQPEWMWRVLREVLESVARSFRPEAADPAYEVPVPHVLRTAELVARDLRHALSDHVPGSHILTLGDWRRIQRVANWSMEKYPLYRLFVRVVRFGMNPVSAIASEVRDAAAGDFWSTSSDELKRWAVGFCVRKAGFYAIQLYSGQLAVDREELRAYQTEQSQQEVGIAADVQERVSQEPLRILVLGQVKAGKSSLINALFGQPRAAVDVVPRTKHIEPYVLEREGIPRAVILDTAGYAESADGDNPFAAVREHVLRSDLVLIVCSARSAARAADRRLLDALRGEFRAHPDRVPPPVVAVLTYIDQLRPLNEWSPPYDVAQPAGPKAQNIADAMQAIQQDLQLAPEEPIVPVCLKPEHLYNIEEGLAPAILQGLPEARRVQYLRCLREFHDDHYWQQLGRQAVNSGRILLKAGVAWLEQRARK